VKWVPFYESADDVASKAPTHLPDHWTRWQEFNVRPPGGGGHLRRPAGRGVDGVFTTREGAAEFVARDPFVLHGVVRRWEIRGWSEALSGS
jgi:hypothetical protein